MLEHHHHHDIAVVGGKVFTEMAPKTRCAAQRGPTHAIGRKFRDRHRLGGLLRRVDRWHNDAGSSQIQHLLRKVRVTRWQARQQVAASSFCRKRGMIEITARSRRVFHVDTDEIEAFTGHDFNDGRMAG